MTPRGAVLFFIAETTRFVAPVEAAVEWVLVAIAASVIALACSTRSNDLRTTSNSFRRLAGRKRTSIVICGLLPVAIRLSCLGFIPVPDPSIHDEFSHLLLGDTLAHGRLTNPTHPMWPHFESIHIIQRPTYNSMYPPGQGSFLALGEVLFGDPWAGVVISVGLMFAAMCWMMQGWLPPAWAFYGTLIAILKFGLTGLWINSYLSGAVPGIGGALLIGSLPRLRLANSRILDAVWLGLGLVVLMNTRPFEGAVLGLAALAYVLTVRPMANVSRLVIPAGLVLSLGTIFTGYYCWRVTGSPVLMPYQVNRSTYGWPENLVFLAPKKVTLRHQVLQDMYMKEIHNRDAYATPDRIFDSLDLRLFENWCFFIGPTLTVPLLFLPWLFRDRRIRPLLFFVGVIGLLNVFQLVLYPYHLGPIIPVVFIIVAQGTRHLYVSLSRSSRTGACYALALIPICLVLVAVMKQHAVELGIPLTYWEYGVEAHRDARASIEAWLRTRQPRQLVVVRYAPGHPPNQEWVYNHADIDGSKVVWAREMDPASDARLLRYFAHREAWLLEADVYPQRVVRYRVPDLPEADSQAPAPPVTQWKR